MAGSHGEALTRHRTGKARSSKREALRKRGAMFNAGNASKDKVHTRCRDMSGAPKMRRTKTGVRDKGHTYE